jgi:hypothetical protein
MQSPSTLSTPPIRQRRFVPPSRVAPVKVKTEPVDIVDEEEAITTFEEDGEVDVKPIIGMEIERYKGKRKRTSTPEGKDVKSVIPGSRDMPIDIDDVEEVDDLERGTIARIPHTRADGRPVIIRNVVYNITYNVINNVVQSEAPPPPPYVPLPGLQAAPTPAAREEIDPDFVPRRPAPPTAAVPLPPSAIPEPEPEIVLSPPQQRILDMVLSGKSVLIHGSAGTGKSVLIRAIKKAFEARYEALNPLDPKVDGSQGLGAVAQARATGDYSRLQMTAEERVAHPLPEKKWKLRVTASTGLAAV